ncbi:MAG: two-component hybrid sensor and regulator [Actinomycetia bacterium]|nr:two-component hybrid sensor and regulator [Actinomycetes bacterium]
MTAQQFLRRLTRFQGLVVAVVILVASTSILTYRWAAYRVRETDTTLMQIETVRSEVLSAESGLRGFGITGTPVFRDHYEQSVARIRSATASLDERLSVAQRAKLRMVSASYVTWHDDFVEPLLATLDSGDRAAALRQFATGDGTKLIDQIRAEAADLAADVRDQQVDREQLASRIGWIGLVATVLGVVLVIGVTGEVRRRLSRRITGPLTELAEVTVRFGSGELAARASPEGVLEVQQVAAAFNAMADRTQTVVADLLTVDRLKSEFVSVVSHELRTPLTSIRGSLGLLASGAMGELPPDASEMLAIASSNTDRLVRLINDILDLERIEAGQDALELAPVRVADILFDSAAGVQGAVEMAGVILEVRPLELVIQADADRLVQALTNLLGNAIKFSGRGARIVLDAEERDHELVLRVRDEGRGIPPEKQASIFERFQQVDASDAREKGGTGLGLAIVRSIAERHGGRVELDSTVGEGSCFSVVLPVVSRAAAKATDLIIDGAAVVVLVEDDADLRQVIGTLLGRHGIQVATAETAAEAIECCRSAVPDLLVLDVRLAEGDGYEVVQALRQDDRLRLLPTVVYTAADLTPEQKDRLRLGDTVFVAKGQRADEALEQEVIDLLARVRS